MDEWDYVNLEVSVSDLEYEKGEYRTLILEARELLIEALKMDTDHPHWQYTVGRWLDRAPK